MDAITHFATPEPSREHPASAGELFVAFTLLALQGFGGVLGIAQGVLCEQRRWLTRSEFVDALALAQVLPGPNVCNLALIVGDRFFGWRGAAAALAGLMTAPLAIVLGCTVLYAQYSQMPAVAGALRGMGAAAAGLIIGSTFRLVPALSGNAMRTPMCILVVLLTFGAVALLRWPAMWTLAGIGAAASLYAWWQIGRKGAKP